MRLAAGADLDNLEARGRGASKSYWKGQTTARTVCGRTLLMSSSMLIGRVLCKVTPAMPPWGLSPETVYLPRHSDSRLFALRHSRRLQKIITQNPPKPTPGFACKSFLVGMRAVPLFGRKRDQLWYQPGRASKTDVFLIARRTSKSRYRSWRGCLRSWGKWSNPIPQTPNPTLNPETRPPNPKP